MGVSEKYPYINQDCYKVDLNLKNILEEITELNKKGDLSSDYLKSLYGQKTANQMYFDGKNCQNVIEYKRLNETAELITNASIQQEKSVLGKYKKEQNIYIGVGALVLLVGLFIVIRK
jgi:hypothetical protein